MIDALRDSLLGVGEPDRLTIIAVMTQSQRNHDMIPTRLRHTHSAMRRIDGRGSQSDRNLAGRAGPSMHGDTVIHAHGPGAHQVGLVSGVAIVRVGAGQFPHRLDAGACRDREHDLGRIVHVRVGQL